MQSKEFPFIIQDYNETGAHTNFETDKAKTDTPTISLTSDLPWMRRVLFHEIGYRLNPSNAVTYALMLFEGPAAGDYHSNSLIIYESPAARVDDTDYRVTGEIQPGILLADGTIYIATDWTGAPGNTTGYLRFVGRAYV